ncbi:MAG: exo-alpha-sialidase [Paracoccaceae bacterium]
MTPDSLSFELSQAQIVARMDGTLQPTAHALAEAYLPSPVVQNHAAFLAFLPNGDLACVWFGGTMEGRGDISIWMSRLAPGAGAWSEAKRLSDAIDRSEQNPVLFTAPDGVVWLFHTSQPGGRQDECEIMARQSHDGGTIFGPPQRIGDFTGIFVRQPLQIIASGRWLLPGFHCITPREGRWTGGLDVAVTLFSDDQGATWSATEVPDSLGAVHMNPVAPQCGVTPAFYRDRFSQYVRRSLSVDGGVTWGAPVATNMPNNNSSVQAIRLADGRIAMVLNPINANMSDQRRASLYDEIEEDAVAGTGGAVWGVPRAPIALALSSDNGETFVVAAVLDQGSGACLSNNSVDGQNRELSYPSILQDPSGDLHIAYTYHRRAIKYLHLALP